MWAREEKRFRTELYSPLPPPIPVPTLYEVAASPTWVVPQFLYGGEGACLRGLWKRRGTHSTSVLEKRGTHSTRAAMTWPRAHKNG